MSSPEPVEFTVDTGLFRQLGELLVGRDATALIELVKNAYDADSTRLILIGTNLEDPDTGTIQVVDDGSGMTSLQFRQGFLRLASRGKTEGARRSAVFERRFTGEKGVGRLAAHKLGALLEVRTIATTHGNEAAVTWLRASQPDIKPDGMAQLITDLPATLVDGTIDWDEIEKADSLTSIKSGLGMTTQDATGSRSGTHITISRLRHAWDDTDLHELSRQLRTFEPPDALSKPLGRSVIAQPLLFSKPEVRDAGDNDPGMSLELQGDFSRQDEYWTQVEKNADWVIEIRSRRGEPVQYKVAPTRNGLLTNPHAAPFSAHLPHPAPEDGPFFDARVLVRPGTVPAVERAWSQENGGVRVYLEGFRVLPYGEAGNDWLSLDLDYTKRGGKVEIDPLLSGPGDSLDDLRRLGTRDVSLRLLPNRSFFGAVFLTDDGSGGLQTLVNREGFVPNESYTRIVDSVRAGMSLFHRAHALASLALKKAIEAEQTRISNEERAKAEQEDRANAAENPRVDPGTESAEVAEDINSLPPPAAVPELDDSDDSHGDEYGSLGDSGAAQGSAARLLAALAKLRLEMQQTSGSGRLSNSLDDVDRAADALIGDASLLRILASVGSQLASYTHEIAHLLPIAAAAEKALSPGSGQRLPRQFVGAREAVKDLRRAIERQTSSLVELSTNESRRRRSRQDLHQRVSVAFLTFETMAASRGVALTQNVPTDIRTPPVFRAELQAVLSNLISNAIRACPSGGRVDVSAFDSESRVRIRIQNTGVAVDLATAEQWFQPFASTTVEIDPVLGQGMGLGLPITRDLVSAYGGRVYFAEPDEPFVTAVEVVFPR